MNEEERKKTERKLYYKEKNSQIILYHYEGEEKGTKNLNLPTYERQEEREKKSRKSKKCGDFQKFGTTDFNEKK